MIKLLTTIEQKRQIEIVDHLNRNIAPLLEKDVSSYAPHRYRLWLFHEASLGKNKTIKNGHWDDFIWQITKQYKPEANIGLISLHKPPKSATIQWHRDDTYAHQNALLINLGGKAIFGYQKDRGSNQLGDSYQLLPGQVVSFNCKHRHALINAEPGRWGLILWKIKGHNNHPGLKPTNPKTF